MNSLTFPPRGTHCVVVDGPECNDAAFAAQWLEMASEADRLLRMVFCHDLELRPDWLIFEGTHPFSETALEFISSWRVNDCIFKFDVSDDCLEKMFYVMSETGFFSSIGEFYHMTVPDRLDPERIWEAVAAMSVTADQQGRLHPEQLLKTMVAEKADLVTKRLREQLHIARLAKSHHR